MLDFTDHPGNVAGLFCFVTRKHVTEMRYYLSTIKFFAVRKKEILVEKNDKVRVYDVFFAENVVYLTNSLYICFHDTGKAKKYYGYLNMSNNNL